MPNDLEKKTMNRFTKEAILFIAQGAYLGRLPVSPGTAGTLLAVPLYLGASLLSLHLYLVICLVIFLAGAWSAGRAEKILGRKDSPSIVIDEVAGYLVAMTAAPRSWVFIGAGFLLFRIFDIVKPYPLRRLERVPGGLGVMLDDLGAAVYTSAVLHAAVCLTNHAGGAGL